MRVELGPRDDKRFAAVEREEREYLSFLLNICLSMLAQRPNQLEALQNAANALTVLGYYEDGLVLDQRLASLRPSDPLILYNLACSLALTHHVEEAFTRLQEAVDLGYRDARHMSRDEDLLNLHADQRFIQLLRELEAES